MNKAESASILDMAMGAIKERVDYEIGHVIDNILDPNTNPTKKRKVVLTLELTPDSERRTIHVSCTAMLYHAGVAICEDCFSRFEPAEDVEEE